MSSEIVSVEEIEEAVPCIQARRLEGLSYGKVEDFCESYDLWPRLASYNGDLKDQQRCWMLKAILTNVPRGARLLEIGAGEPLVADILARLGYFVTVVDPYEGYGNGPTGLESMIARFPRVSIVGKMFGQSLSEIPARSFDCFYSISVMEHVPLAEMDEVVAGVGKFAAPGAVVLHAIDCVLAGSGTEYHTQMLKTVAGDLGYAAVQVEDLLRAAEADPDTYFLSAEAHNRWRGSRPYREFPMRKCISAQIISRL